MAETVDQLTTEVNLKGADLYKAQMEGIERQVKKNNEAQQRFNERIAQFAQGASRQMNRAGNAMIGVAVGIAGAFGLASKVSLEHEAAIERLSKIYGEGSQRIVEFAAAVQDQTQFSDTAIIEAAALGATFLGLRDHIDEAIIAAVNMSEATGRDLRTAMLALGKATIGTVGELREMGIAVDAAEFEAKGIVAVFEQVARENQNIAFTSEDTQKSLAQLRNEFEDFGKVVGKDVEPVVKGAVDRLRDMGKLLNDLSPQTRQLIGLLAGTTGLVALFGGLTLKIGAAVAAGVSATIQGGIYIATLRAEAAAANAAAIANAELAAARGSAAGVAVGGGIAGAGAGAAGGGLAGAIGAGGTIGLVAALLIPGAISAATLAAIGVAIGSLIMRAVDALPGNSILPDIPKDAPALERLRRFLFPLPADFETGKSKGSGGRTGKGGGVVDLIAAEKAAIEKATLAKQNELDVERQLIEAINAQEKARQRRLSTISAEIDVASAFVENLEARGLRGPGLQQAQQQLAGFRFGAAQRLFQESRQAPSREEQLRLFAGALRTQTAGFTGLGVNRPQWTVQVQGVPWKAQASLRASGEAAQQWMPGVRQVQPGHIGQ